MNDILQKLNIFVENNHLENKEITYQLSDINYHTINQLCLKASHFALSEQPSTRDEKFCYGALMIGVFNIIVHAKKSVTLNLHYTSIMISIIWLVFKLLSAQQKTVEFLLCQISLRTIILVAQQIVTVRNERWTSIERWITSSLAVSHFLPNHVLWNLWVFSNVVIFICPLRIIGSFGTKVLVVNLDLW